MAKKKENKQTYATEEVLDALNETAQQTESFFEKNSKLLSIIFGVLVVGALAYFLYLNRIVEPKNREAFEEMNQADQYFEQDSMALALDGSTGGYSGYEQIVENFSGTDAANIAKYKAAIAKYDLGQYESCVKLLVSFDTDDEILKTQKLGMIGNALVQADKKEEGLEYYIKALKANDLEALQLIYLKKAGILAMDLGKNNDALGYFETMEEKYPGANNGEAKKFIERLKGGNE